MSVSTAQQLPDSIMLEKPKYRTPTNHTAHNDTSNISNKGLRSFQLASNLGSKSCKCIEIEIIVHHSQSPVVMVSTLPQLAIKSMIPYLRHWPDQCDHWFVVKGQHRDRDQESQAESGKRRGTCRANERLLWKRWIVQQNRNRKY